MKIALYKGKSLLSLSIRWFTRSEYSHAAFVFDHQAAEIAQEIVSHGRSIGKLVWWIEGSVVESWSGGVKNSQTLSTLHTPGTAVDLFEFAPPLDPTSEAHLILKLKEHIGAPYGYGDILGFVFRVRRRKDRALFCSELVEECAASAGRPLFNRTEAWRVPPDWIGRSLGVRYEKTVITR